MKALKDRGVTNVEWVQVGNETRDGMLFNSDEAVTGQVSKNAANFAAYINAGYDAVKEVYPNAKVIVHVDKGQDLGGLTWLYDNLKEMVESGMSSDCLFIRKMITGRVMQRVVSLTSRLFLPCMARTSSSLKSVCGGVLSRLRQ